ncbi:hypothetical protein H7F33_05120 [Pedobacter sp. PAMC26386]|nr:hypothetical protein H7F33_05120 [Pedobacter sp. PAMC26386]
MSHYIKYAIFNTEDVKLWSLPIVFPAETIPYLDTSFLQYIKLLRIVAAMEMPLIGDKNISEVAYTVGYSNITAFRNKFSAVSKQETQ